MVQSFADEHGGAPDEGFRTLGIYRFSDTAGGSRFLSVAVRENTDDSPVNGNVTFRWRDEPDGKFEKRGHQLRDQLNNKFEMLGLGEARKLKSNDTA